jgi:hypothetical protein
LFFILSDIREGASRFFGGFFGGGGGGGGGGGDGESGNSVERTIHFSHLLELPLKFPSRLNSRF